MKKVLGIAGIGLAGAAGLVWAFSSFQHPQQVIVDVKEVKKSTTTLEIKETPVKPVPLYEPVEPSDDSSGKKPEFSPEVFSPPVSKEKTTGRDNEVTGSEVARKPRATSKLEDLGVDVAVADLPSPPMVEKNSILGKSAGGKVYRPVLDGALNLSEDKPTTSELDPTQGWDDASLFGDDYERYDASLYSYVGAPLDPPQPTVTEPMPTNMKLEPLGEFLATAYDLSYDSCGKYKGDDGYGQTAGGVNLIGKSRKEAKAIAVDPNVIPLGSKVYVEFSGKYASYSGIYTAVDTGSAIKNKHIDMFLGDFDRPDPDPRVWGFGRQHPKVYKLS